MTALSVWLVSRVALGGYRGIAAMGLRFQLPVASLHIANIMQKYGPLESQEIIYAPSKWRTLEPHHSGWRAGQGNEG